VRVRPPDWRGSFERAGAGERRASRNGRVRVRVASPLPGRLGLRNRLQRRICRHTVDLRRSWRVRHACDARFADTCQCRVGWRVPHACDGQLASACAVHVAPVVTSRSPRSPGG
jgi:hypothetical protein